MDNNILFILFYITIGLFVATIIYLTNILLFRTKARVIGYSFKLNSPEYKKYQKRASIKALVYTLIVALALILLAVLQADVITHRGIPDSGTTLLTGAGITVLIALGVLYSIISIAAP